MADTGLPVLDTSTSFEKPTAKPTAAISFIRNSDGVPTGAATVSLTGLPSVPGATTPTSTVTFTKTFTTTTPTASATSAPASSSPSLSVLLPAILAPVVFILILIPIVIYTYLHFRNKRQKRGSSPDTHGPPQETALLQHKTSRSLTLPSPFSDSERIQDGSLGWFDERRNSMDRRSNGDIVAMYERPSNRSTYDDVNANRGAEPRAPPAAAARAAPNARGPPPPNKSRGPPPPRPAKPAAKEPSAQWPLPATTLPSPNSFHSASTTNKPLPSTGKDRSVPQLPPMASEPFSMREELRPDSDTYDLSTSAARNSSKVKRGTASTADPFSKRESDLVSELSDHDADFARRSRRDTDAVSMISAMTGRSQSGRRKSSASVVSAMSPSDEPEMPKPFFAR